VGNVVKPTNTDNPPPSKGDHAALAHSSHQVRQQAYRLLLACWQARDTVGYRLDKAVQQASTAYTPDNARWLRTHVYGTCRFWHWCAQALAPFSRIPLHKLDDRVRVLLQLGAFWLLQLDNLPDYAAVQQAVQLGHRLPPHLKNYINAVLRQLAQHQVEVLQPEQQLVLPPANAMLPPWLKDLVVEENAQQQLGEYLQSPPPLGIRLRPGSDWASLTPALTAAGWSVTPHGHYPDTLGTVLTLPDHTTPQPLTSVEGFAAGQWLLQEASSAQVPLVIKATLTTAPRVIVDACAGLGMKTLALADAFPEAMLIALEPDATRFAQLQANVQRCGLGQRVMTINTPVENWQPSSAIASTIDVVLADVPCSATGTLRRHPELGLRTVPLAPDMVAQQRQILSTIQGWQVANLVLSTCSILPAENDETVEWLVAQGRRLIFQKSISIDYQEDGFFIAILS
jgi:16S rRNA (cytosine967-C5)-methyltransferase